MKEPGKHKLTEALQGQAPGQGANPTGQGGPPAADATPQEIAEETRRKQEASPNVLPGREERLIDIGRGHQTHG
jgi:hypothetical protein